MENLGNVKMLKALRELNPQMKFKAIAGIEHVVIVGNVPVENIQLPTGYYYNTKNGITNKHNTKSGIYECFDYEYNVDYFIQKPVSKHNFLFNLFKRKIQPK